MKKVLITAIAILMMCACSPASKTEQLEKILQTGNTLFDDGYSTEALPYFEQALEFSIREFGEMSAETGKVSSRLAFVYYEKRMFGSARKEYSRLIRILNTLPGARKTELIEAYKKLASIAIAFEDIDGAEELYKHLYNLQKMFLGEHHEDTLASSVMLTRINAYQKDADQLYKHIDVTVSTLEKIHGENCRQAKEYLKLKISFQIENKDLKGELKSIKKMFQIEVAQNGADSTFAAEELNNEAECLMRMGNFAEAEKVCLKALKICRDKMTPENPKLITTCRRLALIYNNLQKIEAAENMLMEAKEYAAANSLNQDLHEEILTMICTHYMAVGNFKKAESNLMELLKIHQSILGDFHPNLLLDYNNLADCYLEQKSYLKAQTVLEKSLELVSRAFGKTSQHALEQMNRMAMVSYHAMKYPSAITKCQEAIDILKEIYPENHPSYMPFYQSLVLIHKTLKDYNSATDYSLKALKVVEFTHGTESKDTVILLTDISDLYKLNNKPLEAINYAERSIKILEKDTKSDKLNLAEKLSDLAALYEATGNKTKAETLYKRSREIYSKSSN